MPILSYRVAPEIFAAHPDFCLGVLVVDRIDNHGEDSTLQPLLLKAHDSVRESVRGNVAEHPRIAAWRDAFRQFGAKPSQHRSSIEAMVRRVLQPASIPSINPLVDIGNIVSLQCLLPVGVHPLAAGRSAIALRPAQPGDLFSPADGGPQESPPPGEIVLAAGNQVLTRRWAWRQAAGTLIDDQTSRVFINVDGLPPARKEDVLAAMEMAVELVRRRCGGVVIHSTVLDSAQPGFNLP